MRSDRYRIVVAAAAVIAAMTSALPTAPQAAVQPAQACTDPTRSISLFAEPLNRGKIGYGFTPETASVPGPPIVMYEGDCLAINLVNDTDRKLSLHAHGVDYTVASDGTPLNRSCVAPGLSRTYIFQAHLPSTRQDGTIEGGSAGYWHYHDHCLGTDHGTGGVRAGLFGALIVRRRGDPEPVRTCTLTMINISFNLRKAPRTPTCTSNEGDRVEIVVIGHGELFHTFHLHGHRWADNRTGYPSDPLDPVAMIDNKTVGPADSFGFQVIAGEHVGPGAWMYHCHVQSHSDAGMSGIFVVKTPEGTMDQATARAIQRWRDTHASSRHGHH